MSETLYASHSGEQMSLDEAMARCPFLSSLGASALSEIGSQIEMMSVEQETEQPDDTYDEEVSSSDRINLTKENSEDPPTLPALDRTMSSFMVSPVVSESAVVQPAFRTEPAAAAQPIPYIDLHSAQAVPDAIVSAEPAAPSVVESVRPDIERHIEQSRLDLVLPPVVPAPVQIEPVIPSAAPHFETNTAQPIDVPRTLTTTAVERPPIVATTITEEALPVELESSETTPPTPAVVIASEGLPEIYDESPATVIDHLPALETDIRQPDAIRSDETLEVAPIINAKLIEETPLVPSEPVLPEIQATLATVKIDHTVFMAVEPTQVVERSDVQSPHELPARSADKLQLNPDLPPAAVAQVEQIATLLELDAADPVIFDAIAEAIVYSKGDRKVLAIALQRIVPTLQYDDGMHERLFGPVVHFGQMVYDYVSLQGLGRLALQKHALGL